MNAIKQNQFMRNAHHTKTKLYNKLRYLQELHVCFK